jgi:hypothetical protein
MVKDKNRDEKFYWACEKKRSENCKARAITIAQGEIHFLKSSSVHNHPANASRFEISQINHNTKVLARTTNDIPAQIIQTVTQNLNLASGPSAPSNEALRKQVKRIRREEYPIEPDSLENIFLPPQYLLTSNGTQFCRDVRVNADRILLFVTDENLRKLSEANYWIMDGTFQTVPRIFLQLYTIHSPVGPEANSRILPLLRPNEFQNA